MNELTILNIDGIECYEKDGTAYLKLEAVARGLGFTTTQNISGKEYTNVRWNRVDEYLKEIGFATSGKRPDFIPENVFYRLAMKAKNDVAEKFQAKVADEIIPSIRKHGGYIAGQETMTDEELLSRALLVADSKIKERDRIIARQSAEIEEMKPKVSYLDVILQNKSLVNTTTIAKDYGMTAWKFNNLLHDLGIQYKNGTGWALYAKYDGLGYTHSYTGRVNDHSPIYVAMGWTQKGRKFLYDFLKAHGIIPVIERVIA